MIEVEKRPGYDWEVVFRDIDDNSLIPATIFGVMTAQQVAAQAHADAGLPDECEILSIVRLDTAAEIRHASA